jgi:hypothetical protein
MQLPFPRRSRPLARMAIERATLDLGFYWLDECVGQAGYRIPHRYPGAMLGSAGEVALGGVSSFSAAGVRMTRFWRL